jgi:hypothetical protein
MVNRALIQALPLISSRIQMQMCDRLLLKR